MPILHYLRDLVLGPEEIRAMTAAYEQALHKLGLIDRADPITEVIAKKIIAVVQTGERNPARISRRALLELGVPTMIRSHGDEAGQVAVAVEDCGVGISAENADQLFNAFFTTKSGGLGMGLSICRSIIEAHGGRISAANNAGPGATPQFVLPPNRQAAS